MYEHERSLVKRLQGKPFALIGVNSDTNREELKKVLIDEHITWRSFWNGGLDGPIAREWQIQGWPTLCLIDAKGVIRNKWEGSPSPQVLDKAIETLLKEMEGATN